jgi:hypothetical protein
MATQQQGPAGKPATIRTRAGRRFTVDRLLLDEVAPIGRVILRVTCRRAERDRLWTSLTAAEARRLAEGLLAQAAVVERRSRVPGGD